MFVLLSFVAIASAQQSSEAPLEGLYLLCRPSRLYGKAGQYLWRQSIGAMLEIQPEHQMFPLGKLPHALPEDREIMARAIRRETRDPLSTRM